MPTAFEDLLRGAFERRLPSELVERVEALQEALGGRETDDFGFAPEQLKYVLPVVGLVYHHWFRVEPIGLEHIPAGRVLLVANHSGQLPLDAMMVATSLLLDAQPPRAVRSMIERWVPSLPFVSTWFSRWGQVLGTPENCRALLDAGHAVLVFPEGVRGINKTWRQRYTLQAFGHGFMRLALETGTPIVPVAVVGAEEQYPTPFNLVRVGRALGLPSLPVPMSPLGPLPLPVKYRIYFGRPISVIGDPNDDEAEIASRVGVVRDAIAALISRGLGERRGWFE
ncbi:MAG: lysophospholipid acyltransferase family protein [bacterium]|nr:acyltransferase family protein [Myxococcales bacterium]MCB9543511.1 acyltransferase family protein [Myxococcales bacterium]